jgi:2-methylcitrate dehydratase PrpD
MEFDRRTVLHGSAAVMTATMASPARAAENDQGRPPQARAETPPPPPAVTQILARKLAEATYSDLPAAVRKEAVRSLLNWTGCAIGGSHHESIAIAIAALSPFSGPAQASILGRTQRLDIMNAALVNGISSHVFDFDDTHLKTIIHPAGPVASAILSYAEYAPVTGEDFLNALVLGIETECRLGNAVYPEHYAAGWHITGTCGVFGAAAAMGKLLHLDEKRMANALGIAATQQTGLKIMFGSMTKSFHPGRAAQNGMMAALLAAKGYTSSDKALEGKDGWGGAVSTKRNWEEVTGEWGTRYEAALNTYKPFACGIVTHPAIDGTIQLRNEHGLTAGQVSNVALSVHPLVLSLTGKTEPQVGLEGKFSIYHIAAAALVEGKAGEKQFSDRAVRDPVLVDLRHKVSAVINPAIKEDQARVVITLKDGRSFTKFVEHAIGSTLNPMTDAALEEKFTDLAEGILPKDRIERAIDLCWRVESLSNAAEIAGAAAAVA